MAKKKGASHDNQLKRLNRVEGQVRGIIGMVEDRRYCLDILTQIKAAKTALAAVERQIIDQHLSHCVSSAISSKDQKTVNSMMGEIQVLLKSVGS